MRIEQTRIIITGAASGIGQATLTQLAAYPCQIVAVDIDETRLSDAVSAIPQARATIRLYACDLAESTAVDALFDHAIDLMGGLDLFVANAGFAYFETLDHADWERLERIYQVNTFSPIYSAVKMRERLGSQPYRIVITASAMGKLALPGYAVYASTKAALDRFAEGYRLELDDPHRLTLVYPIGTRTRFFSTAAETAAPTTWPTQTAEQVARAIVRGIEHNQLTIYPSRLFRVMILLDRVFPIIRILEQAIEKRRFMRWQRQRDTRQTTQGTD